MTNTCAICGKQTTNKVVCGRKCAGKLGGSKPKPIQEKVAKLNASGYWYYTHTMLDESERKLFQNAGRIILVHRYIMTMHIGRALRRDEVVMHISGDKNDNRIENLAIGSARENSRQHYGAMIEASQSKYLAAWIFAITQRSI